MIGHIGNGGANADDQRTTNPGLNRFGVKYVKLWPNYLRANCLSSACALQRILITQKRVT
jgi:hypothetical protein